MMNTGFAPELNVVPVTIQPPKAPSARTVLEELFILLEDYGPTWYSKEHHDRAIAALLGKQG